MKRIIPILIITTLLSSCNSSKLTKNKSFYEQKIVNGIKNQYHDYYVLERVFFKLDKNKEYYFWNLCGYNRNQHKPWDEYLKEIDLLNGKDVELNTDDDDLSWLNDL